VVVVVVVVVVGVSIAGSPPLPTMSKLAEFKLIPKVNLSSINRLEAAFLRRTIRQDVSSVLKVSVSMVVVSVTGELSVGDVA